MNLWLIFLVMKREPNPDFSFIIIIIIFFNSMFNYWFTTVIRVHQILLFYLLFYDVKKSMKIIQ